MKNACLIASVLLAVNVLGAITAFGADTDQKKHPRHGAPHRFPFPPDPSQLWPINMSWHDYTCRGGTPNPCPRAVQKAYPNRFGHPIEVVARSIADSSKGGTGCGISLLIQGTIKVGYQFINNNPSAVCTVTAIVPANNSYEVDFEGPSAQKLDGYYELH